MTLKIEHLGLKSKGDEKPCSWMDGWKEVKPVFRIDYNNRKCMCKKISKFSHHNKILVIVEKL